MMEGSLVSVERLADGAALLLLQRPERKNAVTGPLARDLATALTSLAADPEVRVIVLGGAGGAFCSGLDVKAFNADPAPDWVPAFAQDWRAVHRALYEAPQPIVCAMQRYAINAGAALALASDLLLVGEGAFLQIGEVVQGMAAPYNLAWLARRHAPHVGGQLALVGARCVGPDLLRLGIAYRCVADEQVLADAQALAVHMTGYPEQALTRIKAGLRSHWVEDADTWFDRYVQVDPVGRRPAPQVNPSVAD